MVVDITATPKGFGQQQLLLDRWVKSVTIRLGDHIAFQKSMVKISFGLCKNQVKKFVVAGVVYFACMYI
jgi:hypothetical protein